MDSTLSRLAAARISDARDRRLRGSVPATCAWLGVWTLDARLNSRLRSLPVVPARSALADIPVDA